MSSKYIWKNFALGIVLVVVAACRTSGPDDSSEVKIINGQVIGANQRPAVVILEPVGCSATFVGSRTILTAAHCVSAGVTSWNGKKAAKIIVNAKHGDGQAINNQDTAVLVFANDLAPATMSIATTAPTAGTPMTIVGFGCSNDNGSGTGTKRQGTSTVQGLWTEGGGMSGMISAPNFVGNAAQSPFSDTCPGDSGGPLIVGEKIAGVVSGGGDLGTFFVNVASLDNLQFFRQANGHGANINGISADSAAEDAIKVIDLTDVGLCGIAPQGVRICINAQRSEVTLTKNATGLQAKYQVLQTLGSNNFFGATDFGGFLDANFIAGLDSSQNINIRFSVHPNKTAKIYIATPNGTIVFGGVDVAFPLNNGGAGEPSFLCGQATQNTKICINAQRSEVTLIHNGISASYQVQQTSASFQLPGGTVYYGMANLSFISGLSPAQSPTQKVAFVIHPNGKARFTYLTTQGQAWEPLGNVDTFQVVGN